MKSRTTFFTVPRHKVRNPFKTRHFLTSEEVNSKNYKSNKLVFEQMVKTKWFFRKYHVRVKNGLTGKGQSPRSDQGLDGDEPFRGDIRRETRLETRASGASRETPNIGFRWFDVLGCFANHMITPIVSNTRLFGKWTRISPRTCPKHFLQNTSPARCVFSWLCSLYASGGKTLCMEKTWYSRHFTTTVLKFLMGISLAFRE